MSTIQIQTLFISGFLLPLNPTSYSPTLPLLHTIPPFYSPQFTYKFLLPHNPLPTPYNPPSFFNTIPFLLPTILFLLPTIPLSSPPQSPSICLQSRFLLSKIPVSTLPQSPTYSPTIPFLLPHNSVVFIKPICLSLFHFLFHLEFPILVFYFLS